MCETSIKNMAFFSSGMCSLIVTDKMPAATLQSLFGFNDALVCGRGNYINNMSTFSSSYFGTHILLCHETGVIKVKTVLVT